MRSVRLKNGKFLICENGTWCIKNGSCYVEDGIIKGYNSISNLGQFDEEYDLQGTYCIPAFSNWHLHLGESIFKDIRGERWNLEKYLRYTEKHNSRLSKQERNLQWQQSARFTLNESKKRGVASFCAARANEACFDQSIIKWAGFPLMKSEKLKHYYLKGKTAFLKMKSENVARVGIFLHSLYGVDEDYLIFAQECIDESCFITIHISESKKTRKMEIDKYGMLPIQTLKKYGLLSEKTLLVHGGELTTEELDMVAEAQASIVICPISNIFLNEATINPEILNEKRIPWYIASDGLATGRTLSLVEQAKNLKRSYPALRYEQLLERMVVYDFITKAKFGDIGSPACFNQISYSGTDVGGLIDYIFSDCKHFDMLIIM